MVPDADRGPVSGESAGDQGAVVLRTRSGPLIFSIAWIAVLLGVTALPSLVNGSLGAAAFFTVLWGIWLVPVALASRRAAVVASEGTLSIRGLRRSREWPRSRLVGFRVGHPSYQPLSWSVVMVTDEEVVPLLVTFRTGGRRARDGAERDRDRLAQWLESPGR
jgi:hypothetical protein